MPGLAMTPEDRAAATIAAVRVCAAPGSAAPPRAAMR